MIFFLEIINTKGRLLCCLLFFLISCASENDQKNLPSQFADSVRQQEKIEKDISSIIAIKKYVQQGDLIMRTGKDFTSELMRLSSVNDKTYSHCGIASFENDTLFVYHALGGEWNPDQKLRRDAFELFCNPYENRGIGIFRYELTEDSRTKLFKIIHTLHADGVMFDIQFDLSSDDRMYCSEFVYKSIGRASGKNITLPLTTFNHIKFVAPDNLYMNPSCKELLRLKFQTK